MLGLYWISDIRLNVLYVYLVISEAQLIL